MKVNIAGIWFDAEQIPIQIQLTPADKENLKNMAEDASNYIVWPDTLPPGTFLTILGIEDKEGTPVNPLDLFDSQSFIHERVRQVTEEGFDAKHDDKYIGTDSLVRAAMAYLGHNTSFSSVNYDENGTPFIWPWAKEWWKPDTMEKNFAKAGALMLAHLQMERRKQHVASILDEALQLHSSHISNNGPLDYPEKEYGWLSDEITAVEVGYLKVENDSDHANALREEGFTMTYEDAITSLRHRIDTILAEYQ